MLNRKIIERYKGKVVVVQYVGHNNFVETAKGELKEIEKGYIVLETFRQDIIISIEKIVKIKASFSSFNNHRNGYRGFENGRSY